MQELTTHARQTKEVLPTDRDLPLPVTAILDGNAQDLIQDYYKLPLMEQLAASTETTAELTFPMTVEYAGGQVIGQFLKRVKLEAVRLSRLGQVTGWIPPRWSLYSNRLPTVS